MVPDSWLPVLVPAAGGVLQAPSPRRVPHPGVLASWLLPLRCTLPDARSAIRAQSRACWAIAVIVSCTGGEQGRNQCLVDPPAPQPPFLAFCIFSLCPGCHRRHPPTQAGSLEGAGCGVQQAAKRGPRSSSAPRGAASVTAASAWLLLGPDVSVRLPCA